MEYKEITLKQMCPSISWSFQLESDNSRILIISFKGTYRYGSTGNKDADLMLGIIFVGYKLFQPQKIVLDLTEFNYMWGNNLLNVIRIGKGHSFAIVVGPNCRDGVTSLIEATKTEDNIIKVFDSVTDAVAYLQEKSVDFKFYEIVVNI